VRFAKSRRPAAVAAITLGALVCSTGVAAAHGDGKRPLRIVGVESQFEYLDLGAAGTSLGDQFVFSEVLYRRGRDVGESGIVCTLTHTVPPYTVSTFHCVGTLSLRRGQITLQALIELQEPATSEPFTAAVTGGTGAYRGASGEVRIRDATETRTIYRVRLDGRKHGHGRH
jgi:hypothetical protein